MRASLDEPICGTDELPRWVHDPEDGLRDGMRICRKVLICRPLRISLALSPFPFAPRLFRAACYNRSPRCQEPVWL
jgi:hypothetical protein